MEAVRVLVVDDDRIITRLVVMLLTEDPQIVVAGTAGNGVEALDKIAEAQPDVVILDIEMPVMDGLETVAVLQERHPQLLVVMFSTFTQRGAVQTLQALARGASDYVAKPSGGMDEAKRVIRTALLPKIKALVDQKRSLRRRCSDKKTKAPRPTTPAPVIRDLVPRTRPSVVVIGASTGGPQALTQLLAELPPAFPAPVLVVQHMTAMFTRLFAQRLAQTCVVPVAEGEDGAPLQPGHVLIAPGDRHMELAAPDRQPIMVRLNKHAPQNFSRPSVDPLFVSAARLYGRRVLAVVLTGMGQDGLLGCEAVRDAGGEVMVQDEASSAVWGMPGAVAKAGLANVILPLHELAAGIIRRIAPAASGRVDQVSGRARQ